MAAFKQFEMLQKEMENLISKTENKLKPILHDLSQHTGQSYDISEYVDEFREVVIGNKRVVLSVIGQVNIGKSTLLNSLIFDGDTVLPEAPTPKSARLAKIIPAADDQPQSVKVTFYTSDEWNSFEKSEDSILKEIYERATLRLTEDEINSLLGTKTECKFIDLEDYVTAEGKYADIVKFVIICVVSNTMYMELEVVDTPGMNDPVQSRERQTTEFLRETDAVLFLTRASRFLDSEDLRLTLDYMPSLGLSEGIVVVPQIDVLYPNQRAEYETNLKPRMRDRAKRYAKQHQMGERTIDLIETFFAPENTVEVSAMSHQIGKKLSNGSRLSKEDSQRLEGMKKRGWYTDSPDSMIEHSGIRELEELIDKRIVQRRAEIKLRRPFERLLGEFNNIRSKNKRGLTDIQENIAVREKDLEVHKQKREERLEELKAYNELVRKTLKKFSYWDAKDFPYPELGDVKPAPSRILIESEISQKARSVFRESIRRVKDHVISHTEDIRDEIEGAGKQFNRNIGIHEEVFDLTASLVRELRTRFDNTEYSIEVEFSWNLWKKIGSIFGGTGKLERAQEALETARVPIDRELKSDFLKALKVFTKHVETTRHRIQQKMDTELAEMKSSVDELQSIVDLIEVELPKKRKEWQILEELYNRLDSELAVLDPLYREIGSKIRSTEGRE